jgi:hypothetical protein
LIFLPAIFDLQSRKKQRSWNKKRRRMKELDKKRHVEKKDFLFLEAVEIRE